MNGKVGASKLPVGRSKKANVVSAVTPGQLCETTGTKLRRKTELSVSSQHSQVNKFKLRKSGSKPVMCYQEPLSSSKLKKGKCSNAPEKPSSRTMLPKIINNRPPTPSLNRYTPLPKIGSPDEDKQETDVLLVNLDETTYKRNNIQNAAVFERKEHQILEQCHEQKNKKKNQGKSNQVSKGNQESLALGFTFQSMPVATSSENASWIMSGINQTYQPSSNLNSVERNIGLQNKATNPTEDGKVALKEKYPVCSITKNIVHPHCTEPITCTCAQNNWHDGKVSSPELSIAVKLPSGQRIHSHFSLSDTLNSIVQWAQKCSGLKFSKNYVIFTADVPMKIFKNMKLTLSEAKILNKSLLHLHEYH